MLKEFLPQKKSEAFKYVPLAKLAKEEFNGVETPSFDPMLISDHIPAVSSESYLVFINGEYRQDLSQLDTEIVITYLNDPSYKMLTEERLKIKLDDPFSQMNKASFKNGVFIYVPPKKQVEKPLTCINFITGDMPFSAPRIHVCVGAEAKLNLITQTESFTATPFLNVPSVDITIEKGARLLHTQLCDLPSYGWSFDHVNVECKRDAKYEQYVYSSGAKTTRLAVTGKLLEEGSDISLNGLYYLQKAAEAHTHIDIRHIAPHCTSHQHFKTVLFDSAKSSFEGKIFVEQEAQKTEAYQLNNNLVLGEKASAYAKPNLEIFADDVKASHGATTGQLSKDSLFYFKSRGLDEETSKKLLIQGFCSEILDKFPVKGLVDLANHDEPLPLLCL